MDKYQATELVKKILKRDYDRWLTYIDEEVKSRDAFGQSFYLWKDQKGMIEDDARVIAEILLD